MPDALLRGATDPTTGDLKLPALPDRWVVIRHLYPVGSRSIHVTGWVLDATTGGRDLTARLLGCHDLRARGGDLRPARRVHGRVTVVDSGVCRVAQPLCAPRPARRPRRPGTCRAAGLGRGQGGIHGCGVVERSSGDPLAAATGPTDLRRIMAELGWALGREGEDSWDEPPDPRVNTLVRRMGLTSGGGTGSTTMVRKYGTTTVREEDVAPTAGLPVRATERTFIGVAPTRYHALCHGSVLGVPVDGSADGLDERPVSEALGGLGRARPRRRRRRVRRAGARCRSRPHPGATAVLRAARRRLHGGNARRARAPRTASPTSRSASTPTASGRSRVPRSRAATTTSCVPRTRRRSARPAWAARGAGRWPTPASRTSRSSSSRACGSSRRNARRRSAPTVPLPSGSSRSTP